MRPGFEEFAAALLSLLGTFALAPHLFPRQFRVGWETLQGKLHHHSRNLGQSMSVNALEDRKNRIVDNASIAFFFLAGPALFICIHVFDDYMPLVLSEMQWCISFNYNPPFFLFWIILVGPVLGFLLESEHVLMAWSLLVTVLVIIPVVVMAAPVILLFILYVYGCFRAATLVAYIWSLGTVLISQASLASVAGWLGLICIATALVLGLLE